MYLTDSKDMHEVIMGAEHGLDYLNLPFNVQSYLKHLSKACVHLNFTCSELSKELEQTKAELSALKALVKANSYGE